MLLSLTISDLGVGLLVQPLYVAHLVTIIEQRNNNSAYDTMSKAYFILSNLFALKSFLGVVTLTVDRFLAIHLHLRYQELVTTKRGVAVEISAWVLSASISFISLYSFEISSIISAIIVAVCIIITGLLYCKIYIRSRKTAHNSDSRSASTANSTVSEWRNSKCRKAKKNCACYILRVFVVFSLLFAGNLCSSCRKEW